MKKSIDIILGLLMNFFIFILWVYERIISSDIPVNISYNEFLELSLLLVLSLIIYTFYIRYTKLTLINILLILLPLFLWFTSMQQALRYEYHKFNTIISIIGFTVTLILIIQLIAYRKIKKVITQ